MKIEQAGRQERALDTIGVELNRLKVRARNGIKHLTGVEFTPTSPTPRERVWGYDIAQLFRYIPTTAQPIGTVVIIHSLVTRSHVFDLQRGNSLVEDLQAAGFEVFLLDWGVPGPAQSANSIETYCDHLIPEALAAAVEISGRESVDVVGYCLGAVFAAISGAGNVGSPISNLVMLAPPIDFAELGVVANLLGTGRLNPADLTDETGNVPSSILVASFRLSQPTTDITIAANYWQVLTDDRALGAHLNILGWSGTHIPFPGATFGQIVDLFLRSGALASGVIPLDGGDVHLADLSARVLCVTGSRDFMVPPSSSAPLERVLGRLDSSDGPFAHLGVDRLSVDAGHAGLFVGRAARKQSVPFIIDWLQGAAKRGKTQ